MATSPQDFGRPLILEDYLPLPSLPTHPICAVCHTHPVPHRCSACQNTHYCTPTCQTHDWPLHRTLCKPFTTSRSTRPTPQHRRALFFPTSSKPRFVYLEYGTDGVPLDLVRCFPGVPREDVDTIAFHDRHLPYWVQISYDSNPSGARTLSENGNVKHAFRGPVVAIAYDLDEGLGKPALDADTRMVGPVVEYARLRAEYEGPIFVEQPQKRYTEEEWKKFTEVGWEK